MRTKLFYILAILTVARLVVAGFFELSPNEAYYYQWSQRPDLAYYSAGPGVAMTILASTKILGASEFGVRFFGPLLGLGTSLLVFGLARRIYDERTGFWAAILLQCLPIFNIGTIFMTTAPLSIFFWMLAVWSFWQALEKSPRWSLWWLVTGLAVGMGALCDYINLLLLFSIMGVLAMVRAWRPEWRRPGIYSALLTSALCLAPIRFWNRTHGWITLTQLGEDGLWDAGNSLHLEQPFIWLTRHFFDYSPLLLLGLVASYFCGLWNIRNHRKTAFLLCFSAPLILLYLALSLHDAGDAIQTVPAILTLAIFATHDWLRRIERRPEARIWINLALYLGAAISIVVLNTEPLRKAGIHFYEMDVFRQSQGWMETGQSVAKIRHEVEKKTGAPVFLIANNYPMASTLAWYLPEKPVARAGDPPVYLPESQMLLSQYSFWPGYDTFDDADSHELDPFNTEEAGVNRFMGKNALYLTDRADAKPAESVIRGFERWEYVGEQEISHYKAPVRKIRFFICYNYRTLPL